MKKPIAAEKTEIIRIVKGMSLKQQVGLLLMINAMTELEGKKK